MAQAGETAVRRVHIELRTGDVLELPGVQILMVQKSGQTARMVLCAAPDAPIKKIPAAHAGRAKPAIVGA